MLSIEGDITHWEEATLSKDAMLSVRPPTRFFLLSCFYPPDWSLCAKHIVQHALDVFLGQALLPFAGLLRPEFLARQTAIIS